VVYPAAKTPTATTLTASPASPAPHGAAVTLTATVTPASAGAVHFFDGTADLGTGTYDAAAGKATFTANPADGTHSFTARFTPTDPALAASSSALLSYQVGATAAKPTTTTLEVTPPSPVPHGTKLLLIATVTPPGIRGGVHFFDGDAEIDVGGYDQTTGKAGLEGIPPDGTHAITARFVSDDPAYAGSTSTALTYLVQPPDAPATTPAAAPPANRAPAGNAPPGAPVAAAPPVAASSAARASASASASASAGSPKPNPTVPVTGALTLASSTTDVALLAGLATILVAASVAVTVGLRRYRYRHPRPPVPEELR
jgi:hypothetical protein